MQVNIKSMSSDIERLILVKTQLVGQVCFDDYLE